MSTYACFRPLALTTGSAYNKGRQFLSGVGCHSRQEIEAPMNKYGWSLDSPLYVLFPQEDKGNFFQDGRA
jgi:hypothetical protein